MNVRNLVLLLAILIVSSPATSSQLAGYYPQGGPDNGPQEVSLIQLIANPQNYDKKRIRLIGYLHLEFEGDAIYLHHEDFEFGIAKDAIWINLPKDITRAQIKAVNDHYVICSATFDAQRHGHMGMFGGELEDVTRLQVWPARRESPFPPPPAAPNH